MAIVNGTNGADTILFNFVSAGVTGGVPTSADDTIFGRGGDDIIATTSGNDIINAGGGDDTILVEGTTHTLTTAINGSAGFDTLVNATSYMSFSTFDSASNQIEQIEGNFEKIYGTTGDDNLDFTGTFLSNVFTIEAGSGNDIVRGGVRTHDLIYGGNNNDFLTGNTGNDLLSGDAGDDRLNGNGGKDLILGGSGDDRINGNSNNDTLDGQTGNDTVNGNKGDDTLLERGYSHAEFDVMDGGSGVDTFLYLHNSGVRLNAYDSTANNIEIVRGTYTPIYGNTNNNTLDFSDAELQLVSFIDGWSGDDQIIGSSGDDTIYGNTGDDDLRGGAGNDFINGGSGIDLIVGGGGDDLLRGGTGAVPDRYIFAGSHGDDFIFDFTDGADQIQLNGYGIGFGGLTITSQGGGADSLIDLTSAGGGTIYLENITTGQLSPTDFIFV